MGSRDAMDVSKKCRRAFVSDDIAKARHLFKKIYWGFGDIEKNMIWAVQRSIWDRR